MKGQLLEMIERHNRPLIVCEPLVGAIREGVNTRFNYNIFSNSKAKMAAVVNNKFKTDWIDNQDHKMEVVMDIWLPQSSVPQRHHAFPLMSLPSRILGAPTTIGIKPSSSAIQSPEIYFQAGFLSRLKDCFILAVRLTSCHQRTSLQDLLDTGFMDLPHNLREAITAATCEVREEENRMLEVKEKEKQQKTEAFYNQFELWLLNQDKDLTFTDIDYDSLLEDPIPVAAALDP